MEHTLSALKDRMQDPGQWGGEGGPGVGGGQRRRARPVQPDVQLPGDEPHTMPTCSYMQR